MRYRSDVDAWPGLASQPPGAEIERTTPARPANFSADVIVPGAQALLTGGLVAGLVTFGAARSGMIPPAG
jgi:hypothetical protein